jgi:hypothetical protein
MLISLPIRILMLTLQAVLPDIELRSDALKKEKDDAESAWKLSVSSHIPLSSTFNSEGAAEVAPSSATPEIGQGHSSDTVSSPSSDSSLASSSESAAPEAVAMESKKPQELLDLEEAFKEADNAKRSHQRYDHFLKFPFSSFDARCSLISGLESELKDLNSTLSHVSGAHVIWLAHLENCFSTQVREYTYEFCPFKQASQKSGSSTSLGRFTRFDVIDGKVSLHFENGQRCWQGMDRRALVHTTCGVTSAITLVEEPSTCFYSIQFDTPIACSLSAAQSLRQEIEPVLNSEL